MPTPQEIVTFDSCPAPEGSSPWVSDARPETGLLITDHDPGWAASFVRVERAVRVALGPQALSVEHIGSTAVPGLPAKPIIDVDVTVLDPADESAYVPGLTRAGFVLRVREPWWHEHRGLAGTDPQAILHVFGPDSPETVRHRLFRDWLRAVPEDRERYGAAKLAAAEAANAAGEHMMQYNARKQAVVREIYQRAFADAGLI